MKARVIAYYLHNSILFLRMMRHGGKVLLNGRMSQVLNLSSRVITNQEYLLIWDFTICASLK